MTSLLLDSKHGQATSGVACHHHLGAAHTVERRWAWNNITSLGQHTRSNNVRCGIPSSPLYSTNGRTKLDMTCHHRPCTARTVGRRQAWHAITALEKHSVERRQAWHDIPAFRQHTQSDDVGRGMTSPPLDSTHGRTTSTVACPHRPCTAHIVRRHRAWQMARTKQYWTMWSITCNHRTSEAYMVRRRLAWHAISRLDSTHGRTTSSVGCHHRPWIAHTIALRRA